MKGVNNNGILRTTVLEKILRTFSYHIVIRHIFVEKEFSDKMFLKSLRQTAIYQKSRYIYDTFRHENLVLFLETPSIKRRKKNGENLMFWIRKQKGMRHSFVYCLRVGENLLYKQLTDCSVGKYLSDAGDVYRL